MSPFCRLGLNKHINYHVYMVMEIMCSLFFDITEGISIMVHRLELYATIACGGKRWRQLSNFLPLFGLGMLAFTYITCTSIK